jgi:hypothetical protein
MFDLHVSAAEPFQTKPSVIWNPLQTGFSQALLSIQSDLTYPHTFVLDEIVDKVRGLDK